MLSLLRVGRCVGSEGGAERTTACGQDEVAAAGGGGRMMVGSVPIFDKIGPIR